MRAYSKAAKRKQRRGRPPKEGVYREPNGRASRAKEPPQMTATAAKARQLGISVIDAQNPESASWLGRLHIAYLKWDKARKNKPETPQPELSISTAQYYAALQYRAIHNEHAKAVLSPGAIYDHVGMWRSKGDEAAQEEWCRRSIENYDNVRKAIQKEQNACPHNLWAALDYCVLRDMEMPHMIGDVRCLLNAMNRYFRK